MTSRDDTMTSSVVFADFSTFSTPRDTIKMYFFIRENHET